MSISDYKLNDTIPFEKCKKYYLYAFYHYCKSFRNMTLQSKQIFHKINHDFAKLTSISKNFGFIFYNFPNFTEYKLNKENVNQQIEMILDYCHMSEQEIPSLDEIQSYLKNHPFSVSIDKIKDCALEDLQDCFDIYEYDFDFEELYDSGSIYDDYIDSMKNNNQYTEKDLNDYIDIQESEMYKEMENSSFRKFFAIICNCAPVYINIPNKFSLKQDNISQNQIKIPYLSVGDETYFKNKQIISIEDIIDAYFLHKKEFDKQKICYECDFHQNYISLDYGTYEYDISAQNEAKDTLGEIIDTSEHIKELLYKIGEQIGVSSEDVDPYFKERESEYYKIENTLKKESKTKNVHDEIEEERCN